MYPQTILELDDDEGQKERGYEDPDSPCLHIEGSRPKLDENRSYDRRYSDVEMPGYLAPTVSAQLPVPKLL